MPNKPQILDELRSIHQNMGDAQPLVAYGKGLADLGQWAMDLPDKVKRKAKRWLAQHRGLKDIGTYGR